MDLSPNLAPTNHLLKSIGNIDPQMWYSIPHMWYTQKIVFWILTLIQKYFNNKNSKDFLKKN